MTKMVSKIRWLNYEIPVIFIIIHEYHIIVSTKLSIMGTYAQRKNTIIYVAPNQILTNIEFDLTQ